MFLRCIVGAGLGALTLSVQPATAVQVHTGGENGAYHSVFCPLVLSKLEALGSPHTCSISAGTAANVRRVARNPDHFAFGQLDAFALESRLFGGSRRFSVVRADDVRECVFAVTRNRRLTNYGQIAVNADRLKFVLPAQRSGSARTFEFLQSLDANGLGRARNVSNAADTDDALREALADDSSVTFFVQFPDPQNERFRMIRRLGGHIIPVLDERMLSQKVNGLRVYYAQETEIEQQRWLRAGQRVVTVCTPMILFTGDGRRILSRDVRQTHSRLVGGLSRAPKAELVPREGPFARLALRTRELSREAQFYFIRLSNRAREGALPFMERAYRSAQRGIHEMILKARRQP